MQYRRCGSSGLSVSVLTLGLMVRDCSPGGGYESVRQTVLAAIDAGVTSIDLAAGYGRGAVERALGDILRQDLPGRREQLILASKGGWADGSRKALLASLERSLTQLGVDYLDVFYHHAPDDNTPVQETAAALDQAVRQGKTRYVGISNYSIGQTIAIAAALRPSGTPCLLHQANYNMLNRWIEDGLLQVLPALGMGAAVFSPLAQGLLGESHVAGPRPGSRAEVYFRAVLNNPDEPAYGRYCDGERGEQILSVLGQLGQVARARGQSLGQLALAWTLRSPVISTAIVGMSSVTQVQENVAALEKLALTADEARQIARILPLRWGLVQ